MCFSKHELSPLKWLIRGIFLQLREDPNYFSIAEINPVISSLYGHEHAALISKSIPNKAFGLSPLRDLSISSMYSIIIFYKKSRKSELFLLWLKMAVKLSFFICFARNTFFISIHMGNADYSSWWISQIARFLDGCVRIRTIFSIKFFISILQFCCECVWNRIVMILFLYRNFFGL